MYLISLSASESSFKAIKFNKTGASFILAKQNNPEQHDNSKTYNGVGKSLVVALIDYCLGAKTTSKISKSLQQTLPDWFFKLSVEINNKPYEIIRYTSSPKHILLNEKELSLNEFCDVMEDLFFDIPENFGFLSYRSLIAFFFQNSARFTHQILSYNSKFNPIFSQDNSWIGLFLFAY